MNSRSSSIWFAEPFRIFFPLGLLIGSIGVALWPMWVWHTIELYPANAHVRLMIEGLMGSFIIGFLGTAGPRLLEAPALYASETLTLVTLQVVSVSLHLAGYQGAGDVAFLILLLVFVGAMSGRLRNRQDLPPPNFILVFFGILNAIGGVGLLLLAGRMRNGFFLNQLGSPMLNEGFVLFPILGVGTFLFRRFLGGTQPEAADLNIATAQWKKQVAIAGATGMVIWLSFVMEALAWTRSAALLRGLAALSYFLAQGHLAEKPHGPAFLAQCFRLGALLLVTGLFLPAALPGYRLASLHLTFIGGFTIILFTVSTRVILGHSGQGHLFQTRLRFLIIALALLVLATSSRVAADFLPLERNSHLLYAALIWLGAAAVWGWALLPKLAISTDE